MVGADTTEFYPALENEEEGFKIASKWSAVARRLNDDFDISVGFINGKRCLGGMLELMMHCHYLISIDGSQLGMPEVTLPVVPGMEGCHWPFRKADTSNHKKLLELLLTGKSTSARDTVGWMVDYAGPMEDALKKVWLVVTSGKHGIQERPLQVETMKVPSEAPGLPPSDNPMMEKARKSIMDCVQAACGVSISQALEIQAKHSAGFMLTRECRRGTIGASAKKVLDV